MTKKVLVSEWGIPPWQHSKLTVRDLQDVALAEHAEAYIKQEQHREVGGKNQRSKRNSKKNREWREKMSEKYGGMN